MLAAYWISQMKILLAVFVIVAIAVAIGALGLNDFKDGERDKPY